MSLSATRSRRSNAGNRWAEALAAVQLENGDIPDPDAELSGEDFIGKEEDDIFESDFESTDEEEYAKQGIEDGERQLLMEEKAERRAARAKASKSAAGPIQKILDRAIKGEPVLKKRRIAPKNAGGPESGVGRTGWDAIRQSERSSTVKHKTLVQERLKDAEKRKAHAPKRLRQVAPPKSQDELIAEALKLEEKNTKLLKEFLVKEEEKRAAARRVVRMKIEGPLVRWVSRGEEVRIKVTRDGGEEGTAKSNASILPATQSQSPTSLNQSPPLPSVTLSKPPATSQTPGAPSMLVEIQSRAQPQKNSTVAASPRLSTSVMPARPPNTFIAAERSNSPAVSRRSSTPAGGQRMQVFVEIPTKTVRRSPSASLSTSQNSPKMSASQSLTVTSSQPFTRSPLSLSQSLPKGPLSTSQSLLPSPFQSSVVASQPMRRSNSSPESTTLGSTLPPNAQPSASLDSLRHPSTIRQASVSSAGSYKSRMVMYVELPTRRKSSTPAPGRNIRAALESGDSGGTGGIASDLTANRDDPRVLTSSLRELDSTSIPALGGLTTPLEALPKPLARTIDAVLFPPGGPNFAVVLPSRKSAYRTEKQMRNYVVVELGERVRASFGRSMRAVFGDHADWENVLVNGVKPVGKFFFI